MVSDFRLLNQSEQLDVSSKWNLSTKRFVESQAMDPTTTICEYISDPNDEELDGRYHKMKSVKPSITDSQATTMECDFQRRKSFRFSSDRSLPMFILGVKESGGKYTGGIYVSNVEVESVTPEKTTATALIWVGVDLPEGADRLTTWMKAIHYLLTQDLVLEDGSILDLVGYNFTSDETIKHGFMGRPKLVHFIRAMMDEFEYKMDRQSGDIRFRRDETDRP